MAVAKARNLRPGGAGRFGYSEGLDPGGRNRGHESALLIAEQGFESVLVEKSPRLGGMGRAAPVYPVRKRSAPDRSVNGNGVGTNPGPRPDRAILESVSAYAGNFRSMLLTSRAGAWKWSTGLSSWQPAVWNIFRADTSMENPTAFSPRPSSKTLGRLDDRATHRQQCNDSVCRFEGRRSRLLQQGSAAGQAVKTSLKLLDLNLPPI